MWTECGPHCEPHCVHSVIRTLNHTVYHSVVYSVLNFCHTVVSFTLWTLSHTGIFHTVNSIRKSQSVTSFKTKLKTHLFVQAFQ